MKLQQLHDPTKEGILKIAAFMSGTGSNLVNILEHQQSLGKVNNLPVYEVVAIFSDSQKSNAYAIGEEFGIPVVVRDLKEFCMAKNKPLKDLEVRKEFDQETVDILAPFDAKLAIYAGYMSIATKPLIDAFIGINIHPADLSMTEVNGGRKYTGMHVVRDAIIAGENYLRASVHIVEQLIDEGQILAVSKPLEVNVEDLYDKDTYPTPGAVISLYQEKLKKECEFVIFPAVIRHIAQGNFAYDEQGVLHFKCYPIPHGLRFLA